MTSAALTFNISQNKIIPSLSWDKAGDITDDKAAHPTNPDILYAGSGGNSVFHIVVPRPASLADLTISPPEVETGDTVTVSVLVTNTGDIECTYQVQLMVDGSVEETGEVTLAGGDSQTVTFTIVEEVAGKYSVNIGALSGEFTVKAVPEPLVVEEDETVTEEEAEPTPLPNTSTPDEEHHEETACLDWWVWLLIVIGAIAVIFVAIWVIRIRTA